MGSQDRAGGVSGDWEAGSQQMMKSLSLLALLAGAVAQKPARIGADGKPLLNRPDIEECMKRKSHMNLHLWAQVQLPEQRVRRSPSPADQRERMVLGGSRQWENPSHQRPAPRVGLVAHRRDWNPL